MRQYLDLMKTILDNGDVVPDPRTKVWTIGLSGWSYTMDLRKGFPLLTTKNVPPRLPFEELFWKLRGERNVKPLIDRDIHIWDANAFDRHLGKSGLKDKYPKHSQAWNEEFSRYRSEE